MHSGLGPIHTQHSRAQLSRSLKAYIVDQARVAAYTYFYCQKSKWCAQGYKSWYCGGGGGKKETLYTQHAILLCTQSTVCDTFMENITIRCLNFSCHIVPGCGDNVSVWMIFVALGVNKWPDPHGSDEFFVNRTGKKLVKNQERS